MYYINFSSVSASFIGFIRNFHSLIERGFKQEEQRSAYAEIRFAKFAPELQMTLVRENFDISSGRLGNGFTLTSLRDTLNPLLLGNFSRWPLFPLYRLVLNSAENIPMFQCHTLSDIRKLLCCASLRYNAPFCIPQSKLIDFKEKKTFSGFIIISRKGFAINPLSSNKRLRKKRNGLCQELHQNRTEATTPLSAKTRNIFEI
ncbi:hypothetical protein ALC56_07214 [Trachymyrmex septentrionalis]|uniref:Uncharacterized protein n=1 Tax=Trachymyrmex septentrionalis TaxID=34720 RepID=A0A195FDR7_9HYME|nr:hypothetical protein ALC56_07214 [Trachymyrmex septentrionalis]